MNNDETTPSIAEIARMPLKTLGLRTGMALQTRRLVEGTSKKESQFFGAIEGKGVMVGPLGSDGVETGLTEGEVCVVRGFTGQYEFSFLSKVLQTFEKPFVYALLAYPAQVDARLVRRSMRTKTCWPTTVRLAGAPAQPGHPELEVQLVDISTAGAMIKAPSALATIGDIIQISVSLSVNDAPITLSVAGSICHNNKAPSDEAFFIGLSFKNLTQNDTLLLHYMTQTPQA
jgi:c-di-GMP-binding flagellar brake protein YcgR